MSEWCCAGVSAPEWGGRGVLELCCEEALLAAEPPLAQSTLFHLCVVGPLVLWRKRNGKGCEERGVPTAPCVLACTGWLKATLPADPLRPPLLGRGWRLPRERGMLGTPSRACAEEAACLAGPAETGRACKPLVLFPELSLLPRAHWEAGAQWEVSGRGARQGCACGPRLWEGAGACPCWWVSTRGEQSAAAASAAIREWARLGCARGRSLSFLAPSCLGPGRAPLVPLLPPTP